jgi:glycosyltransferase involved in cell wall biosynthesis
MNTITLSVVVPCYNEAGNLPGLLEAYSKAITRSDVEIVIVNNGSSDATDAILQEAKQKYAFLRVVHIVKNEGYGNGIITGLKEATGKYIGWTHGDFQTPPEDTIRALEILEASKDRENMYVKGRRQKRPLGDVIFTFGMSIFETVLFQKVLIDINAQPNIFPATFFKSWNNPPKDFSLDLYSLYMAKKKGMKVVRFPVDFKKRGAGVSSWNINWKSKVKFIKRTIGFSFELRGRKIS